MEPNQPVNPYQTPAIPPASATEAGASLVDNGRTTPAGNGLNWITAGWNIFTQSALVWIVCMVILLVMFVVLSFVPFLGNMVLYVVMPILTGGLMMGCQAQHEGRPLEIGDLFAGFQKRTVPLMLVGVMYLVVSVALLLFAGVAFFVIVGSSGIVGAIMSGDQTAMASLLAGSVFGALVVALLVLAAYIPVAMAFWFAPTLVALHDVEPMQAIRMSFFACLKNFMPFLLYGIVFLLIFFVAALPLGLGLFVAFPLMYASTYTAYRDIFLADPTT